MNTQALALSRISKLTCSGIRAMLADMYGMNAQSAWETKIIYAYMCAFTVMYRYTYTPISHSTRATTLPESFHQTNDMSLFVPASRMRTMEPM